MTYASIDYPGASETVAHGINSAGVVVGYYNNLGLHGFVSSNIFTSIDYPGSTATLLFGVNDAMQMVGVYQLGIVFHGFEYDAGVFTSFDFPAQPTRANAINDGGTVVGTALCRVGSGAGVPNAPEFAARRCLKHPLLAGAHARVFMQRAASC